MQYEQMEEDRIQMATTVQPIYRCSQTEAFSVNVAFWGWRPIRCDKGLKPRSIQLNRRLPSAGEPKQIIDFFIYLLLFKTEV